MAWSRTFPKCIIFHFLDKFFCKTFYYITRFCDKKLNFGKFANFLADSKSRAQKLSNDVSFVIFGHQTWDLEGGGSICPPPPPAYPGFQVPQQITKSLAKFLM